MGVTNSDKTTLTVQQNVVADTNGSSRPSRGLYALAMGTFSLGIAEFLMMGILGDIAHDMDITVSQAGHFISAYATGVCVGAPALLVARRMRLKNIIMMLAAIIAIGNTCAALSPGYWTFMLSRFISGLPHGAYFGVGSIIAKRLAPKGHEVSAVAFMIGGMTIATLGGVPLGSVMTNYLTWRMAFAFVGLAGVATVLAIRFWVPQVADLEDESFKGQFAFLRTLPPWLIFGGVLFGQTGIYCWYSYIEPQMTDVAHFTMGDMSWIMVLAGAGMFIGNIIAGRLSDRYKPSWIAAWVQASAIPVLLLFYFLAPYKIPAVILMVLGTAALFGSGSPLQSDIIDYSPGGELLGGACIQIAYNGGNAIAAWIGGTAIAHGMGYTSPALVGIPIVAVGCTLIFVLYRRFERHK